MPDKKTRVRFDDPKKQMRTHKGFRKLEHAGRQWEWRVHHLTGDPMKRHRGMLEVRDDRGEKYEYEVDLVQYRRVDGDGWEGDFEYFEPYETVGFRVSITPSDVLRYIR